MDSQPLPHDLLAEQSVLGSLLIDRDAIVGISEQLPADAFYDQRHQLIYRAMLGLWKIRRPCDLVTLTSLLQAKGKLDEAGGVAYLGEVMQATPTSVHAPYYADILLGLARRRDLIAAGQRMVREGFAAGETEPDYDRLFVEERGRIAAHEAAGGGVTDIAEQVAVYGQEVLDRWEGRDRELPVMTGIYDLDRLLGGLRRGSLGMLLARTSMGKSALMLHMARKNPTLIFTLEMAEGDILNRLICTEAELPFVTIQRHLVDPEHKERYARACEAVAKLPITIIGNDSARSGLTTERMELLLARRAAEQGIKVCFIDHLGHVADDAGRLGAYDRTNLVLERTKRMAQRVGVPTIVLGQLNRQTENRSDPRPRLSDARDSGKIEEYADWFATIFRRKRYADMGIVPSQPGDDYWPGSDLERVEVALLKNRNGELGTVHLGYKAEWMKFYNMDRRGMVKGA